MLFLVAVLTNEGYDTLDRVVLSLKSSWSKEATDELPKTAKK